ncbi:MAG: bifunctional folylpolyglutamate synthase/dihydrofolate synthase, partial [Succinivibrio sp.]
MSTEQITKKPGSLETWLDYLNSINPEHMELGLDRVNVVLDKLNLSVLKSIPVVEVAGTNGKGSTAALIAGAINSSGLKAGLYTSPHLHRFNERINIASADVSDDLLCEALSSVYDAAGDVPLTYFEYTTLAALVCFDRAGVDAAILEIGLGGRLDAVNALDADICVITSIGLDHTHILGNTIEKIAKEKAGIIKDGSEV